MHIESRSILHCPVSSSAGVIHKTDDVWLGPRAGVTEGGEKSPLHPLEDDTAAYFGNVKDFNLVYAMDGEKRIGNRGEAGGQPGTPGTPATMAALEKDGQVADSNPHEELEAIDADWDQVTPETPRRISLTGRPWKRSRRRMLLGPG